MGLNPIILFTVFLLAIASITTGNIYWSKQQAAAVNKAKQMLKQLQAAELSQPKEADIPEQTKIEDKKSLTETKDYYLSLFD